MLELAEQLRGDDIECMIDRYVNGSPQEGWPLWMERQIEQAEFVLVVCTPIYMRRYRGTEVTGKGLGTTWEAILTRQDLYEMQATNTKYIPVIFERPDPLSASTISVTDIIPKPLRPYTYYLLPGGYEALLQYLLGRPAIVAPPLGSPRVLLPGVRPALVEATAASRPRDPEDYSATIHNETIYLNKLRAENLYLDIRGLGIHGLFNMELRQVYTRLRVIPRLSSYDAGRVGHKGAMTLESTQDSNEAEDTTEAFQLKDLIHKHRNLVIEGDPGSGKTTFARFVCLNLARALLGEERRESLERIGVTGEPPFPIFIRLSEFGAFLDNHPRRDMPDDAAEHFLRYLDHSMGGCDPDCSPSYLRSRTLAGKCLLLLDGLDEVSGARQRQRVSRIIDQLVILGGPRNNRHIVTSRAIAYMGKAQLTGPFVRAALVEFNNQEIELFVYNWAKALSASSLTENSAHLLGYAHNLLAAINRSANVRSLAGNPLMLSVIAIIHFNGMSELPAQRTELFATIVSHLLESRQDLSELSLDERSNCMMQLAMSMYESPTRVRRAIELKRAKYIVRNNTCLSLDRAARYLEEEAVHSGIIVSKNQGELEFWHLSFQEYLAAKFISRQPDCFSYLDDSLFEDRWREVIQHLAGCLMTEGPSGVRQLIRYILEHSGSSQDLILSVALIGHILRALGSLPQSILQETRYAQATREAFSLVHRERTLIKYKIDVFDALAIIGDHRISQWDTCWTLIDSGAFWIGAQRVAEAQPGYDLEAHRDESPVQMIAIDRIKILKYPVTVQQYKTFVEEDGYSRHQYWGEAGSLWRTATRAVAPGRWVEQLQYPNRPVVNITWYEAEAYCNWLSELLNACVRLPSEAEWEFVARGKEGKKFATPLNKIHPDYANYDGNVGTATPVGLYPPSSLDYEVYDLAGNVWEWCQDSWFGSYEGIPSNGKARETLAQSDKVRRGGSWKDSSLRCRSAFRSRRSPGYANVLVGFRPVMSCTDERFPATSALV